MRGNAEEQLEMKGILKNFRQSTIVNKHSKAKTSHDVQCIAISYSSVHLIYTSYLQRNKIYRNVISPQHMYVIDKNFAILPFSC